jgi:hypothetical protein
MTPAQRKPARRLPDLSSQERLIYVSLEQAESRANRPGGGLRILVDGVVLTFAILSVIALGWVLDIAINGG